MREIGISINELKNAGYSDDAIFKAGYSAGDLISSFPVTYLRTATGLTASTAIKNGVRNIDDLLKAGYSVQEIIAAGLSPLEIRNSGWNLDKMLKYGMTIAQLREAEFSVSEINTSPYKPTVAEMKKAGISLKDMGHISVKAALDAGFTLADIGKAGYGLNELRQNKFTPRQMVEAGFTLEQIAAMDYFSLAQLKASGFTDADIVKTASSPTKVVVDGHPLEMPPLSHVTPGDGASVTSSGFSPKIFKDAGYTMEQMKSLGYTREQMGGIYSFDELKKGGASLSDMYKMGLDLTALKDHGYGIKELYDVGFKVSDLVGKFYDLNNFMNPNAPYEKAIKDLKSLGFPPDDLASVFNLETFLSEYTVSDIKRAGFAMTQDSIGVKKRVYLNGEGKGSWSFGADFLRKNARALADQGYSAKDIADLINSQPLTYEGVLSTKLATGAGDWPISYKIYEDSDYPDLAGYKSLRKQGFSPKEIKEAGLTDPVKFRDFYGSNKELKQAGFTGAEFIKSKMYPAELIEAGYTPQELLDIGYPEAFLKDLLPLSGEALKKAASEKAQSYKSFIPADIEIRIGATPDDLLKKGYPKELLWEYIK